MSKRRFQQKLAEEFAARRAFARFLSTDHSTLSQILRAARPAPAARIRTWAARLGLTCEEAAAYIAAGRLPDSATDRRQRQMHHWTAEALALTTEPAHWEIVRLSRQPGFRADSRWIAKRIGVTADDVNLALARLFRLGLVEARPGGIWPAPPQAPTFAQLFTTVADVGAVVKHAEQMGAKLIIPPTGLPEGNEMAVLLEASRRKS